MSRQFPTARNTTAWLGLLLMLVSFVCLILMPVEERLPRTSRAAPGHGGFGSVILDPGHGGHDSGATCGSVMEKELTLDVAQRIERVLQAQGIPTLMTRTDDSFVSLAQRARISNRTRDGIFVSIHFNHGERAAASGVETYYAARQSSPVPMLVRWFPFFSRPVNSDLPNAESQSLAELIQESVISRTGATDRGAKSRQFYVIRNVTHPAVLVEGGFLTNGDEIAKLANPDYRESLASAITEGILRYREDVSQRRATLAVTAPASR